MAVTPYLHFNGTCEAALAHYASALGATANVQMRWKDAPHGEDQVKPENAELVMHGNVVLADGTPLVMASDSMEHDVPPAGAVSLSITEADAEKAKAIFAALGAGGATMMPFGPVFWGGEFGMCVDKFGMHWMVSSGG